VIAQDGHDRYVEAAAGLGQHRRLRGVAGCGQVAREEHEIDVFERPERGPDRLAGSPRCSGMSPAAAISRGLPFPPLTRRILPIMGSPGSSVVLWAALWIGLAVVVYQEVHGLRDVSDTLVQTGRAVDSTGKALEALGDVPFVGGRVRGYAGEVRRAGRSAVKSGRSSRGHIDSLSVLLALVVGVVPTVPVLAAYLSLRRVFRRGARRAEASVS
jgi:hypothetical protein